VRQLQIQNLKALGLNLAEIGLALAQSNQDATATLAAHRDARQTALMNLGSLGGRAREALMAATADPELRPLAIRLLDADAR